MGTRIKAAILLCLMSAAAYSVCGAYQSMHRNSLNALPAELSAMLTPGEEAEMTFTFDPHAFNEM